MFPFKRSRSAIASSALLIPELARMISPRKRQKTPGDTPLAQLSSSSPAPGTYANEFPPSWVTLRSPCHCMGEDADTRIMGVNPRCCGVKPSLENGKAPFASVSAFTQKQRKGAFSACTTAFKSGFTVTSCAQNKGSNLWMLSFSLTLTQGGRKGPARQSQAGSFFSFVLSFSVSFFCISPSDAELAPPAQTTLFTTSAQIGIVLENESGNRFVVLRVASTMTHPPARAAHSATCTFRRVALKLQLLLCPSVDLK
mmetsp:Transcript_10856/g.35858  ORF Transcript_10856/g.35858 Transcript_10856/m.35858 type:complete len:255 (-) Transcript_10856:363-1127(-)